MPRSSSPALAFTAAASLLLACAGPTFVVQQYAGPARARETIAILRSNASDDARVMVLDEQDVAAPIAEDGRLHIELLPGRHTLVAARPSEPRRRYPAVAFRAEADRVYRVVFVTDEPRIYEVDRSKDATIGDRTEAPTPALAPAPSAPAAVEGPPPVPEPAPDSAAPSPAPP